MLATILPAVLLLAAQSVAARTCYNGYGRQYRCSGLSYGARIGIGIGIAAGVLLLFSLCGFWRRRQLRSQFSKYKPPALPYNGQQQDPQGQNPYQNNPPPPTWNNNAPAPPPATYQPGSAGAYGASTTGAEGHEHGYEWEQARQQEEEERRNKTSGTNEPAPPGYDIATSTHNTGNAGTTTYAPPAGPPPGK
ncbi:hypothetical protein B9479_002567 [Cryptococcus floricola]|uniref:Transmembrane protein n=1 Tax=Cryptococcus floricola TaxID=2591691 RepID=A0A5D3AYR7_9TREE|nr:hypothetical protein B9479_002567 [Cryptococcus floricola]